MSRVDARPLDPADLTDRLVLALHRSRRAAASTRPHRSIVRELIPTARAMAAALLTECDAAGIIVTLPDGQSRTPAPLPAPVLHALARLACAERREGAPCRCEDAPCEGAQADVRGWLAARMRGRMAWRANRKEVRYVAT